MRVWIVFLALFHSGVACIGAYIGLTEHGATGAVSYWALLFGSIATALTFIILADCQYRVRSKARWKILRLISLWLDAKEIELNSRITPVQDETRSGVDVRLFSLPDRHEIIDAISDGKHLSHMQLWSIDGCPVRVRTDATGTVLFNGAWQPFDPWELIREGTPYSFKQFEEKWPGLVSIDEYLKTFP